MNLTLEELLQEADMIRHTFIEPSNYPNVRNRMMYYFNYHRKLLNDNPELYTLFYHFKNSVLFQGISIDNEVYFSAFDKGIITFDELCEALEMDKSQAIDILPENIFKRALENSRISIEYAKDEFVTDEIIIDQFKKDIISIELVPERLRTDELITLYEDRVIPSLNKRQQGEFVVPDVPLLTERIVETFVKNMYFGYNEILDVEYLDEYLNDSARLYLAERESSAQMAVSIKSPEVLKQFLLKNYARIKQGYFSGSPYDEDESLDMLFSKLQELMESDSDFKELMYKQMAETQYIDEIPADKLTPDLLSIYINKATFKTDTTDSWYHNDYGELSEYGKLFLRTGSVEQIMSSLCNLAIMLRNFNSEDEIEYFCKERPEDILSFILCLAYQQDAEKIIIRDIPDEVFENIDILSQYISIKKQLFQFREFDNNVNNNLSEEEREFNFVFSSIREKALNNPVILEGIISNGLTCFNEYDLLGFSEEFKIKHIDLFIEKLKKDVSIYSKFGFPREHPLVKEFMFGEHLDDLEKLKKEFQHLTKSASEEKVDLIFIKMIKSIGVDNARKVLTVRDLTESQISHLSRYHRNVLDFFNVKYDYSTLAKVSTFFNIFDSSISKLRIDEESIQNGDTTTPKTKDARFLIYRRLNSLLERFQVEDANDTDYVLSSFESLFDGIKLPEGFDVRMILEKISNNNLQSVKLDYYEKIENALRRKIPRNLINSYKVMLGVVTDKVFDEAYIKSFGCPSEEIYSEILERELSKIKENGETLYSPVIIENKQLLLDVLTDIEHPISIIEYLKMTQGYFSEEVLMPTIPSSISKNGNDTVVKGWIQLFLKGIDFRQTFDQSQNAEIQRILFPERRLIAGIFYPKESATLKDNILYDRFLEITDGYDIAPNLNELWDIFVCQINEPYSENLPKYFETFFKSRDSLDQLPLINDYLDTMLGNRYIRKLYNNGLLTPQIIRDYINGKDINEEENDNIELFIEKYDIGLDEEAIPIARKAWEITKNRMVSNIPQFNSGTSIDSNGYRYEGRMLRPDEILNLFAGNITDCCQSFDDAASRAAYHASTSKNGGVFVVERVSDDGSREIIAQSWTWRNVDVLCFDNIEMLKYEYEPTNEEKEIILELYKKAADNALAIDGKMLQSLLETGQITKEEYDSLVLKRVTVGTGYNPLIELYGGSLPIDSSPTNPPEDYFSAPLFNGSHYDSEQQKILAQIRSKIQAKKKIKSNDVNIGYKSERVVESALIEDITTYHDDILYMFNPELEDSYDIDGVVSYMEELGLDEESLLFFNSNYKDWYAICSNEDDSFYIAEAKIKNDFEDEKQGLIVQLEFKLSMYKEMLRALALSKNIYIANSINMPGFSLEELSKFSTVQEDKERINVIPDIDKLQQLVKEIEEKYAKLNEEDRAKSATRGAIIDEER